MKIYQIHELYGEYEDFTDRIVGSYFNRSKAEQEMNKLIQEENELREQSEKCDTCPYINRDGGDYDIMLTSMMKPCELADLYCEDGYVDCKNYYTHWGDASFVLEEVEVE